MKINILIADDDDIFRGLLEDILRKNGYHIFSAEDGKEAIDIFYKYSDQIDLAILDVMMPGFDGWEVLSEIRRCSEVPVMMLTALGDAQSEITGLISGADDYIAKPFNYEVFLARVQSMTRKAKKKKEMDIDIGNIKVIENAHKVFVDGQEVFLSRKEYHLLLFFIANPKMVLSRERLIERIWGYDYEGDIRTVDTHIKTLRAKLGSAGKYIETVRGSGYCFQKNN